MAGELRIDERPELTSPVLIAAFRGWNDGAQAASLAAGYLAKTWQAERFAHIDPEEFFDFQATRPHVSLERGMTRKIEWPETAFYHARPDGLDHDVVLLLGIEPNLRWQTFTDLVVGLVRELGVDVREVDRQSLGLAPLGPAIERERARSLYGSHPLAVAHASPLVEVLEVRPQLAHLAGACERAVPGDDHGGVEREDAIARVDPARDGHSRLSGQF